MILPLSTLSTFHPRAAETQQKFLIKTTEQT